jgi:hypothetical protein
MSTPTGLRSEALSRRPATPWQLSQGEEAEVMRERMTEFEYIIEYLDENDAPSASATTDRISNPTTSTRSSSTEMPSQANHSR